MTGGLLILAACLALWAARLPHRTRTVPGNVQPAERLRRYANRAAASSEFTEEQVLRREAAGREVQRVLLQRDLAAEIAKLPYVEPAKPQPNIVVLPIRRRA